MVSSLRRAPIPPAAFRGEQEVFFSGSSPYTRVTMCHQLRGRHLQTNGQLTLSAEWEPAGMPGLRLRRLWTLPRSPNQGGGWAVQRVPGAADDPLLEQLADRLEQRRWPTRRQALQALREELVR